MPESNVIDDAQRGITVQNRRIDDRGLSTEQASNEGLVGRHPVRHDSYSIHSSQLPAQVQESLKPGDRLLVYSAYQEGEKQGEYVGHNVYSVYNTEGYLVSDYTEKTQDTVRGTANRLIEEEPQPPLVKIPKRKPSKEIAVDKDLEARKRRAIFDLEKAPYESRIQEIYEQIGKLEAFLRDPIENDIEEKIDYWTSMPDSHGMLSPAGIAAAGRIVGKLRRAKEKIEDLKLEAEALKEMLELMKSENP